MHFEHGRERGCRQFRIAVASVADSMKRPSIQTLFAYLTIAVVVKRLHHRYALLFASVIHRRRDHRKEVVNVNDVWPHSAKNRLEFMVPATRPDAIHRRPYFSNQSAGVRCLLFDLFDADAILREKLGLRLENLVFATRLDVAVVHAQHAKTRRLDGSRNSKGGHN